jgi:hypothetical protein
MKQKSKYSILKMKPHNITRSESHAQARVFVRERM